VRERRRSPSPRYEERGRLRSREGSHLSNSRRERQRSKSSHYDHDRNERPRSIEKRRRSPTSYNRDKRNDEVRKLESEAEELRAENRRMQIEIMHRDKEDARRKFREDPVHPSPLTNNKSHHLKSPAPLHSHKRQAGDDESDFRHQKTGPNVSINPCLDEFPEKLTGPSLPPYSEATPRNSSEPFALQHSELSPYPDGPNPSSTKVDGIAKSSTDNGDPSTTSAFANELLTLNLQFPQDSKLQNSAVAGSGALDKSTPEKEHGLGFPGKIIEEDTQNKATSLLNPFESIEESIDQMIFPPGLESTSQDIEHNYPSNPPIAIESEKIQSTSIPSTPFRSTSTPFKLTAPSTIQTPLPSEAIDYVDNHFHRPDDDELQFVEQRPRPPGEMPICFAIDSDLMNPACNGVLPTVDQTQRYFDHDKEEWLEDDFIRACLLKTVEETTNRYGLDNVPCSVMGPSFENSCQRMTIGNLRSFGRPKPFLAQKVVMPINVSSSIGKTCDHWVSLLLDMDNKNTTIYNSCPSYDQQSLYQVTAFMGILNDAYDLGMNLEPEVKRFGNGDGWSCGYEVVWFCQQMASTNEPPPNNFDPQTWKIVNRTATVEWLERTLRNCHEDWYGQDHDADTGIKDYTNRSFEYPSPNAPTGYLSTYSSNNAAPDDGGAVDQDESLSNYNADPFSDHNDQESNPESDDSDSESDSDFGPNAPPLRRCFRMEAYNIDDNIKRYWDTTLSKQPRPRHKSSRFWNNNKTLWEYSQLPKDGRMGCINPRHITLERRATNRSRNKLCFNVPEARVTESGLCTEAAHQHAPCLLRQSQVNIHDAIERKVSSMFHL
jgi:hypothetical protein